MEFFNDLSVLMKFLVAFVIVLAVLGAGGYLWRRLLAEAISWPWARAGGSRVSR